MAMAGANRRVIMSHNGQACGIVDCPGEKAGLPHDQLIQRLFTLSTLLSYCVWEDVFGS
jgi:hypothetical protein